MAKRLKLEHKAVLLIKRHGKPDRPALSIVGDSKEVIVFELGEVSASDPLTNVMAVRTKD